MENMFKEVAVEETEAVNYGPFVDRQKWTVDVFLRVLWFCCNKCGKEMIHLQLSY